MSRKSWLVGSALFLAVAGFAGIIYLNVQDFLEPSKPGLQGNQTAHLPPNIDSTLPQTVPAPSLKVSTSPLPTLSPERRKVLEAYKVEAAEISKRYREQRQAFKGNDPATHAQMKLLAGEKKRELKKELRQHRHDLQAQQLQEIEALRAKYGITKQEVSDFFVISLEERRHAALENKTPQPPSDLQDQTQLNDPELDSAAE